VRLVGIHRPFIAHCYRRVCPAVTMCKAESCTTAAGLIWQTVKRLWACYKREVVRTTFAPTPCTRRLQLYGYMVQRKTATLSNGSVQPAPPCLRLGCG
jgi:hypothetical protein